MSLLSISVFRKQTTIATHSNRSHTTPSLTGNMIFPRECIEKQLNEKKAEFKKPKSQEIFLKICGVLFYTTVYYS